MGAHNLELYILPLLLQALNESEEHVVERVLTTMVSLAELRLFSRMKLREVVMYAAPFLCHPNGWIRGGIVEEFVR